MSAPSRAAAPPRVETISVVDPRMREALAAALTDLDQLTQRIRGVFDDTPTEASRVPGRNRVTGTGCPAYGSQRTTRNRHSAGSTP